MAGRRWWAGERRETTLCVLKRYTHAYILFVLKRYSPIIKILNTTYVHHVKMDIRTVFLGTGSGTKLLELETRPWHLSSVEFWANDELLCALVSSGVKW